MIKQVLSHGRIPVKIWSEDVENGALLQALNLSNHPLAYKHVALMPDCHEGYGMPIGGVLATQKGIIPNAVGVDIGCGMCAVKTPWKLELFQPGVMQKIVDEIKRVIPVGFSHHATKQDQLLMPLTPDEKGVVAASVIPLEYQNALTQLGTLGGGNHFIEIQVDGAANVWIMIHSGSRNLGKQVADHYNRRAIYHAEKWCSIVPVNHDLAFLPLDSNDGVKYLAEMQFCVDFALANRKLMMTRIADVFNNTVNWLKIDLSGMINIAHNYVAQENHFGANVWVHRKGATRARDGDVGIIPGSQGSKSYIVKGLGNEQSFMSCSHGAGRRMGRAFAKKTLNLQEELDIMNSRGIIHSMESVEDLDEATGAYKDIDVVMRTVELRPVAVVKG
jgi:tRNA-splicing ligase RtcB